MKDERDDREHPQLFDLIARVRTLPWVATRVVFNGDATAVAFDCADGSIRLAATVDKASPNTRMRRAADTGQLTISPRTDPLGVLKTADYTKARSSGVNAFGASHFAFGTANGRIDTLMPCKMGQHGSEALTDEEKCKDAFFNRIAAIGGEMTEGHGKDFATGACVLAAH